MQEQNMTSFVENYKQAFIKRFGTDKMPLPFAVEYEKLKDFII